MAKPSQTIGEFLSGLVEDADKLNDYLDPEKQAHVLEASGLSKHDQDLLRKGDPKKIMAEVHKQYRDVIFLPLAVQHVTAAQNITAPQNILAPPDEK